MAEIIIPPGFGLAKLIWTDNIGGHVETCSIGYGDSPLANTAQDDANFFCDICMDIPSGSGRRPGKPTDVPSGWEFTGVQVYKNVAGVIRQAISDNAPLPGAFTAGALGPLSMTARVTKRTDVVGRKFTGRMFAPLFITGNDINQNGQLNSDARVTVQARYSGFYTAVTAEAFGLYVLHGDAGTPPTLITSLFCQPSIGFQKRRINR